LIVQEGITGADYRLLMLRYSPEDQPLCNQVKTLVDAMQAYFLATTSYTVQQEAAHPHAKQNNCRWLGNERNETGAVQLRRVPEIAAWEVTRNCEAAGWRNACPIEQREGLSYTNHRFKLRFTACLPFGKTRYFCENNLAIANKSPYYQTRKVNAVFEVEVECSGERHADAGVR
jgi:hypothetical protein